MCMICNHDTATVTLPLELWDIIIDVLGLSQDHDLAQQVNDAKAAIELEEYNAT